MILLLAQIKWLFILKIKKMAAKMSDFLQKEMFLFYLRTDFN
jgi:hypothetical protein